MHQGKKVAFVTGGTGGIGTAICQELYTHGYFVVAGYYSSGNHGQAKEWAIKQKEDGYKLEIAYGEITKFDSCQKCINEIVEKFGKISILVNNAGITRDATFSKMSLEQWTDVVSVNLNSVFMMTKLVIEGMLEEKWGRIINISSINAQKGQFGQSNYSAAKAGMHGFTKALALEVARKGITVNTISPGYIETKMIADIDSAIKKEILKSIPMGRFGQPSEIGKLVSFLSSDSASFITGANISINGGQHMM
ncbi:MAG: acetoacetyl-CoA reductase [SAR324 cluster bacterium]|nr:acetoacetyl-CoA reductase [SAR324 cluster bacterium]